MLIIVYFFPKAPQNDFNYKKTIVLTFFLDFSEPYSYCYKQPDEIYLICSLFVHYFFIFKHKKNLYIITHF